MEQIVDKVDQASLSKKKGWENTTEVSRARCGGIGLLTCCCCCCRKNICCCCCCCCWGVRYPTGSARGIGSRLSASASIGPILGTPDTGVPTADPVDPRGPRVEFDWARAGGAGLKPCWLLSEYWRDTEGC